MCNIQIYLILESYNYETLGSVQKAIKQSMKYNGMLKPAYNLKLDSS